MQAGEVTATGMHVNVQSEGGLLIKFIGQNDQWGMTATAHMENDMKSLKPASTYNLKDWFTATAAQPGAYGMNEDSYIMAPGAELDANKQSSTADNQYFVMKQFKIRATNASSVKGLKVSAVEINNQNNSAAQQELSSALRIALQYTVGNNTSYFISAPVATGGSKTTYTVYDVASSGSKPDKSKTGTHTVTLEELLNHQLIASTDDVPGTDETAVTVNVYIWYEGQDPKLYSDNVHANEELSITLKFASDTVTNAAPTTTP